MRRPAEFTMFYKNVERNALHVYVRKNFFWYQDQPRLGDTTTTFIVFIRSIPVSRLLHANMHGADKETTITLSYALHDTSTGFGFTLSCAKLLLVSRPRSRYTRGTSHDCICDITRNVSLTQISRHMHKERHKTVSVRWRAKSVSRPFSGYHARRTIQSNSVTAAP